MPAVASQGNVFVRPLNYRLLQSSSYYSTTRRGGAQNSLSSLHCHPFDRRRCTAFSRTQNGSINANIPPWKWRRWDLFPHNGILRKRCCRPDNNCSFELFSSVLVLNADRANFVFPASVLISFMLKHPTSLPAIFSFTQWQVVMILQNVFGNIL